MPGGQIQYQEVPRSHELAEGMTKTKLNQGSHQGACGRRKRQLSQLNDLACGISFTHSHFGS